MPPDSTAKTLAQARLTIAALYEMREIHSTVKDYADAVLALDAGRSHDGASRDGFDVKGQDIEGQVGVVSACRSCGAELVWGESKSTGKSMPLDAASKEKRSAVVGLTDGGAPLIRVVDTYVSHFAVCDDPERFRGGSS